MPILNIERRKQQFYVIYVWSPSVVLFWNRIVGDDDGGQTFTPEEYDEYKKRVLPMVSHKLKMQRIKKCI